MKKKALTAGTFFAAIAMLTLILDTKTALSGAKAGLALCIEAAIPSLFPFFVFSAVINSNILGSSLSLMAPFRKLCKIPQGTESIMLLGFIAGYPVGAQLIGQAHSENKISTDTAKRMLGFCSNAGLSFIFGMLSPMFQSKIIPWVLWGIHISSAMLVGIILPKTNAVKMEHSNYKPISFSTAMQKAIKNCSLICGWIILFRIVIAFVGKWFMWRFPEAIRVLFSGLLELSNGCVMASSLPLEGLRFVLVSCMLAAGGTCVAMQTLSVTGMLGSGQYFQGKILQAAFALLFSILLQPLLFQQSDCFLIPHSAIIALLSTILLLICLLNRKILVAFAGNMLYNTDKHRRKGATVCCSVKK